MTVRGQTLERVEARIRAALELEDTREGHVHRLAREALRALIYDEDGREDVATELICLGANEPCSVGLMFKATIGEVLRYDASQGVDSPELTDDQLANLRPASGPGEIRRIVPGYAQAPVRIGVTTTEARVNYEGGAFIDLMVEHYKSGYEVRVSVRLVERDDDPYHGLTLSGFAFYQTLEEAFTSAGSITLEFDGKTYTRAWIKSLTKEG